MTETLQVKFKLLGNPKSDPQFKTFIKNKKNEDVPLSDPRANRALISLMDMYAVLGGAASHYGGPAALAEIWSALHGIAFAEAREKSTQWFEMFHLVNDAGHCENGLYALKANYNMASLKLDDLKKFRDKSSPLTGHGEVHCFPEGVLISNGPLGSGLPQSQGLALADGLNKNPRVTVTTISDGGCMEGEAKESLAAIPGLAKSGKLAPFVMIISDNNTKLSGRIDKDSYSLSPTFESLNALGWKVLKLEEAHNLQKCFDMISEAISLARNNPAVPVCVHAKTIKGIGTKKTQESSSGGHGFPLKSPTELPAFLTEIYNGEKYPEMFDEWINELIEIEKQQKVNAKPDAGGKIQKGVSSALIKAKKSGLPIISITSDLPGSTGVAEFRKEFPQSSIDVGVAESNMISTAIGLSKSGFIPVVDTFAQFGVTKGALPLIMSSLSEGSLIGIFSHTGFQDAADGASHQSLSYLSMTASIPNVYCFSLSCSAEADQLITQAVQEFSQDRKNNKIPKTYLFFLGRENFPPSYTDQIKYNLWKAQILVDSSANFNHSITIATHGSTVPQAIKAANQLANKGVGAVVVNSPALNKIDLDTVKSCLQKTKGQLLTVEDHQLTCGFGSILTHDLLLNGVSFKVKSLGVKNTFGRSAYTADDLYKMHRIDAEAILAEAMK